MGHGRDPKRQNFETREEKNLMPPPLKMGSGSLEDIMMGAGRGGGGGASSSASGSASDVESVRFVGLRGSEVVVVPQSPTTVFMFCRSFFLFFSFSVLFIFYFLTSVM